MESSGISVTISDEERQVAISGFRRLTKTEYAVLQQILDAKSVKEVARSRGISPSTVETHKVNIMNKLGVSRTNEVFRIFLALSGEISGSQMDSLQ